VRETTDAYCGAALNDTGIGCGNVAGRGGGGVIMRIEIMQTVCGSPQCEGAGRFANATEPFSSNAVLSAKARVVRGMAVSFFAFIVPV